jgi:hypothetical protein
VTTGDPVRNTQSRLAVGIDKRGEGGFVIWWPAAGYSVISNAAPAPWPLIHDGKGLLPPAVPASILKPLERAIARAPEERRNSILFWAANGRNGAPTPDQPSGTPMLLNQHGAYKINAQSPRIAGALRLDRAVFAMTSVAAIRGGTPIT